MVWQWWVGDDSRMVVVAVLPLFPRLLLVLAALVGLAYPLVVHRFWSSLPGSSSTPLLSSSPMWLWVWMVGHAWLGLCLGLLTCGGIGLLTCAWVVVFVLGFRFEGRRWEWEVLVLICFVLENGWRLWCLAVMPCG